MASGTPSGGTTVTMQVRETSLQELISGMKQFRVPMFQRTYTWKERDHTLLWRDILGQYEMLLPGAASGPDTGPHFIGSFVLAPTPAPATLPAFLVVDGQQRLTTLTLALCALREAAAQSDPMARERITNQYLINPYGHGDERWKFVPTEQDKHAYFACIDGKDPDNDSLIAAAYRTSRCGCPNRARTTSHLKSGSELLFCWRPRQDSNLRRTV